MTYKYLVDSKTPDTANSFYHFRIFSTKKLWYT